MSEFKYIQQKVSTYQNYQKVLLYYCRLIIRNSRGFDKLRINVVYQIVNSGI